MFYFAEWWNSCLGLELITIFTHGPALTLCILRSRFLGKTFISYIVEGSSIPMYFFFIFVFQYLYKDSCSFETLKLNSNESSPKCSFHGQFLQVANISQHFQVPAWVQLFILSCVLPERIPFKIFNMKPFLEMHSQNVSLSFFSEQLPV